MNRQLTLAVTETERQLTELRTRVGSLRDGVKAFAPHAFQRAFQSSNGGTDQLRQRDSHPATASPEPEMRPSHPTDASFVQSLSDPEAKSLLLVRFILSNMHQKLIDGSASMQRLTLRSICPHFFVAKRG